MAIASQFETEFSIDWLLELTGMKATTVLGFLNQYLQSGVLSETEAGWFRFKSQKEQKAFRNSLTKKEAEASQSRMLSILTKDWQHDEKSLEILSGYLLKAVNDIDGCRWLIMASAQYHKRAMHQESINCLVKALDDLYPIRGDEADRLYIRAAGHYFDAALARGESKWSNTMLKEAIRRTEAISDKGMQAVMYMHMAGHQWQNGNATGFHNYFELAKCLMEEISDPKYIRAIESFCVMFYCWQGLNRETVETYERLVQDVDSMSNDSLPLYATTMAAWAYISLGNLNQGLGMLDAICSHSLKINRPDNFAFAVYYISQAMLSVGRTEEVHQFLTNLNIEENQSLDPRIRQDIALLHAMVLFEKGELEKSKAGLRGYLARVSNFKTVPYSSYKCLLKFCWVIEQGDLPPVKGLSLEDVIESGFLKLNVHFEAMAYRYQALLQNKQGASTTTVLATLNRSLEYGIKSGYVLALADTKIEMARMLLKTSDRQKARKLAREAAKDIMPHKDLSFPGDLKFLIGDMARKDNLLIEILRLAQSISTTRESDDIIKQIILTVIQITGAERGAIFLFKEGQLAFELKAAKNLTADDITQPEFADSMGLIRETASSKQGTIKKLNLDRSVTYHNYHHIRSCACIPMIVKNKVVGVFYFDNHFLASAFRKKDLTMFSFFASQAAIAIDNAEAYGEVKRLNLKLDKENQYYREQQLNSLHYKNFIGESTAIKEVLGKIEKVADTDTIVLITGETGVGKELVAGTIMDNSSRSEQPFIRVNCNAFSENLIASELFGHEKGAFTGADRQRAGRFELANNGTLFLDEIGDIPHKVQLRLLRVLQTQEFERIGGTQTLKSNFRLIAATNQNLQKRVKSGQFREDLYFRLNVFPIHVPPLRERSEDIPYLAHFFLREFAKKSGKPFSKILDSEIQKMLVYSWPGNVRELQNVIERGIVLSTGSVFRLPKLESHEDSTGYQYYGETLADIERYHILATLDKTAGKISGSGGAAEKLGLHHNTLRSKMGKLGIKRQTGHK